MTMSDRRHGFFEKKQWYRVTFVFFFKKNKSFMLQKGEKQQYHVTVFDKKPKVFRNKQK